MRDEAEKRIGHLYPKLEITAEMAKERPDLKPLVGQKLTVIAWIWARTVKSPNPAFSHVDVPLASTFILSSKQGKQAYVEVVTEKAGYRFIVKSHKPSNVAAEGTKASRGNFRCVMSDSPISGAYVKEEGKAGRMGKRLMAIVAESPKGRVYVSPDDNHERIAHAPPPSWQPNVEFFQEALGFRVGNYGLTRWSDLFTARQLVAHTTFGDVITDARERVRQDALAAGFVDDDNAFRDGGNGSRAYAEAISIYLAFAQSRMADWGNSLGRWESKAQVPQQLFGRQAIPMVWDFCETNVFLTCPP
jgi:putative DNA methylase